MDVITRPALALVGIPPSRRLDSAIARTTARFASSTDDEDDEDDDDDDDDEDDDASSRARASPAPRVALGTERVDRRAVRLESIESNSSSIASHRHPVSSHHRISLHPMHASHACKHVVHPRIVRARRPTRRSIVMTARDAATMFVLDVGAVKRCARRETVRTNGTLERDDACRDEKDEDAFATTTMEALARTVRARAFAPRCNAARGRKKGTRRRWRCAGATRRGTTSRARRRRRAATGASTPAVVALGVCPPDARTGETYERDIIEARASDDVADVVEAVAVACDALIRAYAPEDATAATPKRLACGQGGGVDHGRYRGEDDAETERRCIRVDASRRDARAKRAIKSRRVGPRRVRSS